MFAWALRLIRRKSACGRQRVSICFDNSAALAEIAGASVGLLWVGVQDASPGQVLWAIGLEIRMRNGHHDEPFPRDAQGALARCVVDRLVARELQAARHIDPDLLARILRNLVSPDPLPFLRLRTELGRARVSDTDLVEVYFPEAARALGCDWAADRSSWAEVSIGIARMQAVVHEIGRGWCENVLPHPSAPTALLLLPEGEQHSFGPLLLLHQLRRRGVSVHLKIAARPADLAGILAGRSFDYALISVGCEARLGLAADLVAAVEARTAGGTPVAVGGAVLDRPVDVAAITGANLVTNDLDNLLVALGTTRPLAGLTTDSTSASAGKGMEQS